MVKVFITRQLLLLNLLGILLLYSTILTNTNFTADRNTLGLCNIPVPQLQVLTKYRSMCQSNKNLLWRISSNLSVDLTLLFLWQRSFKESSVIEEPKSSLASTKCNGCKLLDIWVDLPGFRCFVIKQTSRRSLGMTRAYPAPWKQRLKYPPFFQFYVYLFYINYFYLFSIHSWIHRSLPPPFFFFFLL